MTIISYSTDARPLVITLRLDPESQRRLDRERQQWFPRGRSAVGAHLTLFHAVPGGEPEAVRRLLEEACAQPRFSLEVSEVMSLGRGAAYRVRSDQLDRLHGWLQRRWWDGLTAQDRQGFRAHVTVQNKADAASAQRCLAILRQQFEPWTMEGQGIAVWRYQGGPWEHLFDCWFAEGQVVG